MTKCDKSRS